MTLTLPLTAEEHATLEEKARAQVFGASQELTTHARLELPPRETRLKTAEAAEGEASSAPAGALA